MEQDLLTLPGHLRSPLVFGGVRVVYSLVFCVVSCVLLFICLSFFICSHGVVSLFSIYEFDCPSGTFRPSFKYLLFARRFQRKSTIRNRNGPPLSSFEIWDKSLLYGELIKFFLIAFVDLNNCSFLLFTMNKMCYSVNHVLLVSLLYSLQVMLLSHR